MKRSKKIKIILLLFLLVIPYPVFYKDGGTISFKALSYSYTRFHKAVPISKEFPTGYDTRKEFKIFPFNIIEYFKN